MIKHTRCCSLQTITANPDSRGTSPQTVPHSSTKGTRPVWPNFPTNSLVHAHWFLGSRSQTSSLKKKRQRPRPRACNWWFNKTDTTCNRSIWVWWRTWYQMLLSYFYVSQISRQTYIKTMQPRPFEEWIEKGTPTRRQPVRCLCTPHKRTLFGEGRRGVQTRLFCILCQGV